MVELDLHSHSWFSFDGFIPPRMVVRLAKMRGLSGIAITDHGTIEGGLRALDEKGDDNFLVIVGTEVCTEIGDIMGLFLEEEITSRESEEVVRQIHQQGGIAIVPHPYDHHGVLFPELVASLDAVEVCNGRVRDYSERVFREMVAPYGLATTGGSDAHLPWEVGQVWTEVDVERLDASSVKDAILRRRCRPGGCNVSPSLCAILLSKVMKRCRVVAEQCCG